MQEELKSNRNEAVSMDLIDRFDESRMHLEAFLEGIYNTALVINDADTITVFCSMAQGKVKEMEKVFEKITGKEVFHGKRNL
ncbi:MAG: hypothetical protein M0Z71_05140 [Nitrospiraceae bacterium]|nr:hypothetical protein [Nitrospiraceae bacterium]